MKYRFKTTPYAHQVAALKKMRELRFNGALLMAPRTGKTKVAIDSAAILHQAGECDRVVVVCPVSVIGVWEAEIALHCPFATRVVVWDKRGRKKTTLPPWGNGKLTFVIINYDAFSVPGAATKRDKNGKVIRRSRVRGGKLTIRKDILNWHPHMMILDESHRIKTVTAAKTRMLHGFADAVKYKMILTGTVVTKKKRVFDIYSQWMFLNPQSKLVRSHTHGSFKAQYGVFTSRNGYPQWLRNQNEAKLKKLLHAESFAVTRDECFDLPPRRDQIIPVELTGHNAEVYDRMAADMIARLKNGDITEASIKLVQSLRLAQLTSGITRTVPTQEYPTGRLMRVGRDKLVIAKELLSDLFEADEKIVIAARWRADIAALKRMVGGMEGKIPAFELHGGVPDRRERDRQIAEFAKVDGPAAFIMQPAAGSLGIDLSAASIFLWFSLTNSYVDFTQAEDRIALSNRSTIFMYLIAPGIDQIMYDALMEDGNMVKSVTDSPDRLSRNFKRDWVPKHRAEEVPKIKNKKVNKKKRK